MQKEALYHVNISQSQNSAKTRNIIEVNGRPGTEGKAADRYVLAKTQGENV